MNLHIARRCCAISAIVLVLLGLAHIAALIGGYKWVAFLGAPDDVVQAVRAGKRYPQVMTLLIALVCLLWSTFAFSGAGLIRRLPLLRTGMLLISAGMIARAFGFIAILAVSPHALDSVCGCDGINTMVIVTSLICLVIGAGLAAGLYGGAGFPAQRI